VARDRKPDRGGPSQNEGGNMTETEIVENVIATRDAFAPTCDDFEMAIAALGIYEGDQEQVQALVNVIAYLDKLVASKQRRAAVNLAKREYAAEHGIKFSQVRVCKKAVA
jgi:hypothetical protein